MKDGVQNFDAVRPLAPFFRSSSCIALIRTPFRALPFGRF